MAELTPQQSRHVENLITRLMARHGVNRSEAINQLHLLVCKGVCNWYKNSGGPGTGFDPGKMTVDNRVEIEELMDQLAVEHNVTKEELMKWFHVFRCHS